MKTAEISYADVRFSPFARLLRRWPVFVTAGGCSPELPLFVYRSGEEALFRELLPEFRMPPDLLARTEQRSLIFFAPAGIPFALCALLTLLSVYTLPSLTVTLLFPTVFFAAGLAGLPALHLRLPPGPLPDGEPVAVGCQCEPHQPDLRLSRPGQADRPQRAVAGRAKMF